MEQEEGLKDIYLVYLHVIYRFLADTDINDTEVLGHLSNTHSSQSKYKHPKMHRNCCFLHPDCFPRKVIEPREY